MTQLTAIVALCGPAGSGKSTIANYLVETYGAKRYSFAKPLKEMVKLALDFTDEQVYGTQEQKETVDARYGKSPRWFLQRIGTDGCRAVFGPDFWTKQCLDMINRDSPRLAVIDDMRFGSEAEAVTFDPRMNGFVFRLWPVDDTESTVRGSAAGAHASELGWLDVTASLELRPKERGIVHLHKLADAAMEMIPVRARGVQW